MYVCTLLFDRVIRDREYFMFIFLCRHVCMSFSDSITKDRSCGEMIAHAGEWHEDIPSS